MPLDERILPMTRYGFFQQIPASANRCCFKSCEVGVALPVRIRLEAPRLVGISVNFQFSGSVHAAASTENRADAITPTPPGSSKRCLRWP
jgi:hypothetical protein